MIAKIGTALQFSLQEESYYSCRFLCRCPYDNLDTALGKEVLCLLAHAASDDVRGTLPGEPSRIDFRMILRTLSRCAAVFPRWRSRS